MPNISSTGFRLVRNPGGSGMAQPIRLPVASGYQGIAGATNIHMFVGDLVAVLATGYISCDDNSSTYLASTAWYGVVVGIDQYWDAANGQMRKSNPLPGATTYGALVERESRVLVMPFCDGQIWEAEMAGIAVGVTRAAYLAIRGANIDVTFAGVVAATGMANIRLDDTTVNTTNTLPFRIWDVPDETTFGPQDFAAVNVKVHVSANIAQQPPVGTATGM